jgi:hypothetical protein
VGASVVSEATIARLAPLLGEQGMRLAYHLQPLPRGLLTAAQGGLAVLYPAASSSAQRYDQAQRLRFQLMGLLPPGQGEIVVLNDCRLAVAAAAVERGQLVYSADEAERRRYELLVLGQMIDVRTTLNRFFGPNEASAGR